VSDPKSEFFFDARDGVRLFFRRFDASAPRGLVAIVHGFAEHSGRYLDLARRLNQANFSAAAFDYRGHGQSGGRRAHIDSFEEYLNDARSFLDQCRRMGFERPVLLGHSLGGLIAARLAQGEGEGLSALVLSSPFLGLAMKVPAVKRAVGNWVSRWIPTLSMSTGLDPAWLSHDREVVERYASDPLVSKVCSARWFTETTAAQEQAQADAGRLALPLFIQAAGDDRLSDLAATRAFFERCAGADKTLKVYDGLFHEIYNETERDRVVSDLTAWLQERMPAR
jgi:alpha-beta hydrolase superfamily lysophospholipase